MGIEPNPNRTRTLVFEPNLNPSLQTRQEPEQNPNRTEPNPNNEGSFPSLFYVLILQASGNVLVTRIF